MTLNFCRECNNLLYPREDVASRTLLYACRNCAYQHRAKSECVYTNHVAGAGSNVASGGLPGGSTASLASLVHKETILDPTLKRTRQVHCPVCGHDEAAFFARSEVAMELVFVCTSPDCTHHWIQGEKK